jgi:hypothetical protein
VGRVLAGDGGVEEELEVFEHVGRRDEQLAVAHFGKDDAEEFLEEGEPNGLSPRLSGESVPLPALLAERVREEIGRYFSHVLL